MRRLTFTFLLFAAVLNTFADNIIISDGGSGTGTTTWTANNTYILDGFVFVNDGQTLTIEAGTVIKGKPGQGEGASALIVARGGKLIANGTAAAPIIFTAESDDLAGSVPEKANSLWGGVILLGKANTSNATDSKQIEGVPTTETRAQYGGSDDSDGSGTLQFVSIRHGGTDIGEGNEINGLTMGACGSATIVSFLEVISNKDDGIEFFGGTPRMDHILIANVGDDCFDYDEGFTGYVQFWAAIQDEEGGIGDRLGEHDGGPSDCETCEPYSHPIIHNVTDIGRGAAAGNRTITFRDDAGGEYHNSIFLNQAKGIDIEYIEGENEGSYQQWEEGNLIIADNIFYQVADGTGAGIFSVVAPEDDNKVPLWDVPSGYESNFEAAFATWNNTVADPGVTAANPVPTGDVSGPDYTGAPFWFARVDYKGAFAPGGNWAGGWTLTFSDIDYTDDEQAVTVPTIKQEVLSAEIYPNPVSEFGTVCFDYESGDVYTFSIYNVAGVRVREISNISSGEFTFDRGELESGVYIYRLSNQFGKSLSGKILMR